MKSTNTNIQLVLFTLIILISFNASADGKFNGRPNWYFGGGFGPYQIKPDDGDGLSFSSINLNGGVNFNRYVAIEGQFGLTNKKTLGRVEFAGFQGDVDAMNMYASLYLRLNWARADTNLYGLVGVSSSRLVLSGLVSDSQTDSGLGYGFGIDLFGNDTTAVTFKFLTVLDEDGWKEYAGYLGLTYYMSR